MEQQPINVLLVSSHGSTRFRRLLSGTQRACYAVEVVQGAEAALARLSAKPPEVCFLDHSAEGAPDISLLRRAREQGHAAPWILLTGREDGELETQAMRLGAADCLVMDDLKSSVLERSIRYAIERHESECQLRKLAAFARLNPHPALEFNADGQPTFWNEAALQLARSMGAADPVSLLPPDAVGIVSGCLASGMNRLGVQVTSFSRVLNWSFLPVPLGRVVHAYANDVTDRVSLLGQKMEAVGQLAAGVAHDFNNLLTVIQGHANLLLARRVLDPEGTHAVADICKAADRAGSLVRQLLLFSRKQVVQLRALDLYRLVDDFGGVLHRVLGEHIVVQVAHAPGLLPVRGDPGMIEQMLMNLAVNARDAMPGGGQLTIVVEPVQLSPAEARGHPEAQRGPLARLSVSDTGHGIRPELLPKLFEPFFTTKEVGNGTGLGLATVYGIVKQHSGWIEVRSRPGEGTAFQIYLPAAAELAEDLSGPAAPDLTLAPAPGRHQGQTILVVEDEAALRDLVVEILQIAGFTVLSAESGLRALEVWGQHKASIDLVLTDIVMPGGIMGRELGRRLQDERPELKVIYTTGYSPGMPGGSTEVWDGDNFLPKPYAPSKLIEMVERCLAEPPCPDRPAQSASA